MKRLYQTYKPSIVWYLFSVKKVTLQRSRGISGILQASRRCYQKDASRVCGRLKVLEVLNAYIVCTIILFLAIWMFPANQVIAQDVEDIIQLRGSAGFDVRAYTVNGIAARRAPLIARSYANLSFNMLGLSSGVNLSYSTQDSRIGQSMNQLAFNTSWDWGNLSAGTVSPSFSRYGMRGISVRGVQAGFRYGDFELDIVAGRNKKAIEFDPDRRFREPAFQRMAYGARIGYGKAASNYIRVSVGYVRDAQTSIDAPDNIAPAENVNFTTEAGVSFSRFRFTGEITASAISLDTRNPETSGESLFIFPSGIITPRQGSYVDYAGQAQMQFIYDDFRLQADYERIQPGFQSLGLSRIFNDTESIRLQPSIQFLDNRIRMSVNSSLTRNNLLGQLQSTYQRLQLGTNINARISDEFTLGFGYNFANNENRPDSGVSDPVRIQQRQVLHNIMVSPSYNFTTGELRHGINLSASLQFSDDLSDAVSQGLRDGRSQTVSSNTLGYNVQFPNGLSLNSSGDYIRSESTGSQVQSIGANLGTGYRFMDGDLNINGSVGWSSNTVKFETATQLTDRSSNQLNTTVSANYRLSSSSTVRFQVRGRMSQASGSTGTDYQELEGTLRFNYRF